MRARLESTLEKHNETCVCSHEEWGVGGNGLRETKQEAGGPGQEAGADILIIAKWEVTGCRFSRREAAGKEREGLSHLKSH